MSDKEKRPLEGIRVVEFAGLAPGPFCVLADLGATVIRVDNTVSVEDPPKNVLCRGKQSIAISPKTPAGHAALLRLISTSHVLIDPFRPGVMENLGLGPEVFLGPQGLNPRLIYARLVGFDRRGHDINYLAHSGVLGMMPPTTPQGRPAFPLNILADMAGGGLICATGILAALYSLANNPAAQGKVVETDMVAGTRYISTFNLLHTLSPNNSMFSQPTGKSLLDGGAPFYNSYQCSDGGWMSVGCIEPKFFAVFCKLLEQNLPPSFNPPQGSARPEPSAQHKRDQWQSVERWIEAAFKMRPRHEWQSVFKGTDACVVAVLTPSEAAQIHGSVPVPHPNFVGYASGAGPIPLYGSEPTTPLGSTTRPAPILPPGAHTFETLRSLGLNSTEIAELKRQGALGNQVEKVKTKL
ncbi:Alpha-methylacyl-CoA racemase [Ceratobasidium theobromae]|uniref:Alpha-methylacyl-CoA racemase n=1 Tax=Ceratobasidium theobromae TaxID=1582974 RepID=A0A5N5QJL5_9AGAM|nr:Alpha-methylacyl-CoA racemase [Ceratobasidium theobromae]